MTFNKKYEIIQDLIDKPSKRRSGRLMPGVKFIVAHDTGNPGSTARANVRYYQRSKDTMSASAHIFVDDEQIIECIPALIGEEPPEKAWHVWYRSPHDNLLFGYDANDYAIGVEYCYGKNIDADEAYQRYVWVMAYICHRFDLDPKTSVVGHAFLDPERKTDPVTGLLASRRTYEQLLRDVVEEYELCLNEKEPVTYNFIAEKGTVRVTAQLNIRIGQPSTRGHKLKKVSKGEALKYVGYVTDGENINGISKWFKDHEDNYFWSGVTRKI